jgi:HK97 family phage major capsid protein
MEFKEQQEMLSKALDEKLVEFEGKIKENGKQAGEDTKRDIVKLSEKFEDLERVVKKSQFPFENVENNSAYEQIKKGIEGRNSEIKSYRDTFGFETKANVLETTSLGPLNVENFIAGDRRQGTIILPERKLHVRNGLNVQPTTSDKWSFQYEDIYTDATSMVVEGTTYSRSETSVKVATVFLKKCGATMNVSRELLDDAVGFQAYVSKRMNDKLLLAEDVFLMHGSGVSGNILGIYNFATPFVAPATSLGITNKSYYDVIAAAALQATVDNYMPTAVYVHPNDFTRMALTKDTQGRYILPIIFGEAKPRIMNLEVIESTFMYPNEFVLGDFKGAADLIQNQSIRFDISFENNDNFDKDLVTLKISERIQLVCYLTKAFIKGYFVDAGSGGSAVVGGITLLG